MREIEGAERAEAYRSAQKRDRRQIVFLVAVIGVNLMALSGQSAWLYGQITAHLPITPAWYPAAAVLSALFGVVLESIGVYLMLQAHDAMMEGYASGSLRVAAYGVAGVMAGLNYDHFSHWSRALGVVFALVSLLSPFLWAVRTKAAHRAQLAARGIVDPAGVKLSSNRKFWHPFRSLRVIRWASWSGETDPARAVSGWEGARAIHSLRADATARGQVEIQAQSAPQIERPATLEIATERADSETVTETETVTRTVERKRSVSSSQRMAERLSLLRQQYPSWETEKLTYEQIGGSLSLSGSQTIKGIRDALYGAQSVPDRVING